FKGDDGIPGPRPVNAALFVLITLPLAWRRRAPLAVVAVVAAAAAVQAVFFDHSNQPSTQLWLAVLIALYSVAAHGQGRDAMLGGALVAVGTLAIDLRHLAAGQRTLAEVAGEWALFAGVWLLGRYLHGWRLRAHRQQARADQLELDREEQARAAVAQERTRIARELHDIVAHGISVMVVQARGGRRMVTVDPDEAHEAFDAIESTGRQALVELRRLLGMLRQLDEQPALAPQPSLRRLGELIQQVQEAGLPVQVAVEGDAVELPPGVDLSAYRIVQEALTNTLKHAGPATAQVLVRYHPGDLELEISDDGHRATGGDGSGQGLIGMRERVTLYGGEFHSGHRTQGGYLVRARLPLPSGQP
ncbi:MAG TPA: histidine kinase, partial [Actinomycetes bacterium]|nr:histidine kinase [Actinomycetes bacterium]